MERDRAVVAVAAEEKCEETRKMQSSSFSPSCNQIHGSFNTRFNVNLRVEAAAAELQKGKNRERERRV